MASGRPLQLIRCGDDTDNYAFTLNEAGPKLDCTQCQPGKFDTKEDALRAICSQAMKEFAELLG